MDPFAFELDDRKYAASRWSDKASLLRGRANRAALPLKWLLLWRAAQYDERAFAVRAGLK
jgi:hypothetical protein